MLCCRLEISRVDRIVESVAKLFYFVSDASYNDDYDYDDGDNDNNDMMNVQVSDRGR